MRGNLAAATHYRAAALHPPLIRPLATFSLRAKSRLRRLRFDTRLRAQPQGGRLIRQKFLCIPCFGKLCTGKPFIMYQKGSTPWL